MKAANSALQLNAANKKRVVSSRKSLSPRFSAARRRGVMFCRARKPIKTGFLIDKRRNLSYYGKQVFCVILGRAYRRRVDI
jgi:hypothetical protein